MLLGIASPALFGDSNASCGYVLLTRLSVRLIKSGL